MLYVSGTLSGPVRSQIGLSCPEEPQCLQVYCHLCGPWSCIGTFSPALSPAGTPWRDPGPVHHLPCLGPWVESVTSTRLHLPSADTVWLCRAEGGDGLCRGHSQLLSITPCGTAPAFVPLAPFFSLFLVEDSGFWESTGGYKAMLEFQSLVHSSKQVGFFARVKLMNKYKAIT